jgi:hypothetical protein
VPDQPAVSEPRSRSPSGQVGLRVWIENHCQCQVSTTRKGGMPFRGTLEGGWALGRVGGADY